MDTWTRRKFLLASGVTGAGVILTGAAGLGLAELLSLRDEDPATREAGRLVIVTLYGGNDGLNTVIPFADRRYHDLRPELAYRASEVLRLDAGLGLNPALTGLRTLWRRRQLAIVLGVGYPRPDRSHFRSMDIWQTASPRQPIGAGWVGRWLDGTDAPPEAAVSFEPVLPPLLAGDTRAGSCVSTGGLWLPPGVTPEMITALGRAEADETLIQGRAAASYAHLVQIDRLIHQAAPDGLDDGGDAAGVPATDTGGNSSLAGQLALVAQCVEAGVPTRVYSVSLGGFDTHADERPAHERLLKQFDSAMTAFQLRMDRSEAGRRVTTLVYSEFGRRVRANASDGTDHGTAGPVFLLGAGVAGGFHGAQPSLADLDDGDLKATVDFRDVLGTVMASVLEAEPERYLAGYKARAMPLFHAE
jgi:uncharacterized protein (DUF1501 family)